MENSAGAGGTIGRSIGKLATIYPRSTGTHDSASASARATSISHRRHRPRGARRCSAGRLDHGLDRLRALHVNDSAAPLGSNRDRHENIGEGLLGEELGVFLGHPKLQGLPAVLETAGPDKRGPDANEVRKAKEIRERALAAQ